MKRSRPLRRRARSTRRPECWPSNAPPRPPTPACALEDIEEEVGDLEELIATKLEDAVEAKKGNPGAPS